MRLRATVRTTCSAAWMFDTERKEEGEHHYRRALALFPYDPFMAYNLAMQYQIERDVRGGDSAVPLDLQHRARISARERAGRISPSVWPNANQPVEAREQALLAMQYGGARLRELRRIVQFSDSVIRKAPNARAHRAPSVQGKSDHGARVTRKVLAESRNSLVSATITKQLSAVMLTHACVTRSVSKLVVRWSAPLPCLPPNFFGGATGLPSVHSSWRETCSAIERALRSSSC